MKQILVTFLCLSVAGAASAHSASDAYLTLSVNADRNAPQGRILGQWDIALRDLDFALKLDDNGDGQVTWGELKRHQAAIERYVYEKLAFRGEPGNSCSIKPGRSMIDAHADGAYAALFFEVVCTHPPRFLTMDYTLFFAIDPSHRGIFVMHAGDRTSTAVLSPQNEKVILPLIG